MKVLIACEFSRVVADAFEKRGHSVYSCDLLPPEGPGRHFQMDLIHVDFRGFDLIIAFPDCTDLAVSGARWFKNKEYEQSMAVAFIRWIASLPCPRIAIENPIGVLSTKWRKPDQIIQPWQFGHGEVKATCFWLKGLPLLEPTNIVRGRKARVHREPPGIDRWKRRSRTLTGIASAMAEQWG